jgi:hypothetical protein
MKFQRLYLLAETNVNQTNATAISLDDDSHFYLKILEIIEDYFFENANCGLVAFRNFLGKNKTDYLETEEKPLQVKLWDVVMHSEWSLEKILIIRWFVFYGEEDFASYHLF